MNQAQARLAVGLLLPDAGHPAVLLLSGTVPLERDAADYWRMGEAWLPARSSEPGSSPSSSRHLVSYTDSRPRSWLLRALSA